MSVAVYDNQEANTPFVHTVRWYDEPNTTSTITYKLYINVGQNSQNNEDGWINRAAAIGNDYEEEGVSTSIAIEHAKRGNPLDSENALSIPEFAGSDPDNKLYNNGGVLHFNGNPVGSGGVMMQFEDTNLLSHQGSYTLKHNETNFCVANENAQLSTFRLTQIGSSGTGKYNVSIVVKNNNAGKLTAIKEQSSTVTVIPIENIHEITRYQNEPSRDKLIHWYPLNNDYFNVMNRKNFMHTNGRIVKDPTTIGGFCDSQGNSEGGMVSDKIDFKNLGDFTLSFWWQCEKPGFFRTYIINLFEVSNKYGTAMGLEQGEEEALGYGIWGLARFVTSTNLWEFYVHINGAATHYVFGNQSVAGNPSWDTDKWTHMTLVVQSNNPTMYVNGQLASWGSAPPAITWPDSPQHLQFGGTHDLNTHPSAGKYNDIRLYNRALSANEISEFYNTINDKNAGGVAIGNIKPPINLTKNELVSVEVRPIGGEHDKYTTKVNVDLMGNSGTVLDGTSKWDNDTQGISYSAGNVGIGILNPSEKLSISDNVRIDGLIKPKGTSGTPGQVLSLSNDGLSMIWKNETVATVSTSIPGITSLNGKIGIGTTTPSTLLVVGEDGGGNATHVPGIHMKSIAPIGAGNNKCYVVGQTPSNNVFLTYYATANAADGYASLSTYGGSNPLCLQHAGGKVGIGTTTPTVPFHVYSIGSTDFNAGTRYQINSSGGASAGGGTGYLSMRVRGRAWFEDYIFSTSDRRIKENIEDVPDDLALQQVRNIPTRYYEYKDKINKGESKTIGFIAQEVKEVLPIAVTEQTSIIPNENRALNNIEWREYEDKYKLLTNIQDASGVKYRFYVTNDLSDNEVMKEIVGNADNTFTFEEKWEYVFCYGKEVDDFHVLDKQKLFALNFSATQELDRKVARLESENAELKAELAAIKAHLGL